MRLRVRELRHRFGERQLFDGVAVDVSSFEMIALMGPSGSGKSTLMSFVAGVARPDQGEVTFDAGDDGPRISWIVQSTPLLPRRTGLENVALGPLSAGASKVDAENRATHAMVALGVEHSVRTKVFRLSGGERQRLAVARAVASSANVILADEPTASLDPSSRGAVIKALRVAADMGAMVLISTHDPAVSRECDRTLMLIGGVLRDASFDHGDAHA